MARDRSDLLVRIRTHEQIAFGKPEIALRDSGGNDRPRSVARRDHIRSAPALISAGSNFFHGDFRQRGIGRRLVDGRGSDGDDSETTAPVIRIKRYHFA